jgi:superfamily II DNA/RNA helicase
LTFKDLKLNPALLEGIDAMGFKEATPIQEEAIPIILEGHDLIGSAQTGTGKTAAFLLPILHKIIESGEKNVTKALIIAPTRELVKQIDQQIQGLSYFADVNAIPVYGGGDGDLFAQEQTALKTGAPIVVATPGRLIAHLAMNYVKFGDVDYLILDEADRMLDMGFYNDIVKIISYLPKDRQNLFFSATMPQKAKKLADEILKEPKVVSFAVSKPAEKIVQLAFNTYDQQKIPVIKHVLSKRPFQSIIVFCSTKDSAKKLFQELKKLDYSVSDIHSDLEQKRREEILNQFKARKLNILVATDILSRGIDIEDIDLVINYDVPNDGEDYIHRIGRTARAASSGIAITLINEKDQRSFAQIEQLLEKDVTKGTLPAELGEGPKYDKESLLKKSSRPFRKGGKGRKGRR